MVELEFAQALEVPNQKFSCSFNVPLDFQTDVFKPHCILGNANVNLSYFVDYDSNLHLNGNVRVPCKFVCDRCGSTFEKNLFLELNEVVCPKMSEEDELSYDMPVVVLDNIISSFVLINFPSKVLCNENCKGLCSKCGTNLNDSECECSKIKIGKNNPFADLLNSEKLGGKK